MGNRDRALTVGVATLLLLAVWAGGAPAQLLPKVEQNATSVGQYEKLEVTLRGLSFADVPWEYWSFPHVEACYEAGITQGYPENNTYRPHLAVDRAQMSVYIARALAAGDANVPTGPATATFPDVPGEHWAFKYVEYAVANGVVQGYPEGNYRPGLIVDRAQMAVFVARSIASPTGEAGLIGYVPPAQPSFSDVATGHWAYKYIEYCKERGVVEGYGDGTYRPSETCTRDQMSVYVARAFGYALRYGNLYDPEQCDIVGVFGTPSEQHVEVPGFFYAPLLRSRADDGREVLTADGNGVFKIRFAWPEVGSYSYEVLVRSPAGERSLWAGSFDVASSGEKGFVRRSSAPLYFRFDSGDSYFAIGENMCWPTYGGTYDYDLWLGNLTAHGGNHIRLWLVNEWNDLGLEHLPLTFGDPDGLGRYDQDASWRIDYILDLSRQLGTEVMMCIDSFNTVDSVGIYGEWDRSPYNTVNGGPCANPRDFFTDADAKRLFKQRLRYFVSRWGYQTSVLSWEFWNEVDISTCYCSSNVTAWHAEMGDYLRSTDPWQHLITTSFANTPGDAAVDSLPQMDYVQSHSYGAHDLAGTVEAYSRQKTQAYGKPHYFGEFGNHWLSDELANDPTGIHFHNGLWSAMLSRSAGTAMLWWWDIYIEPRHLYDQFPPVAAFASDVDWVAENYDYATIVDVSYVPSAGPTQVRDMSIDPPAEAWSDAACNEPHTYTVGNDGTVGNLDILSRVQHGLVNHPTWHNPATFAVNYPVAGRFEVWVWGVSGWGGAGLTIRLDGAQKLTADFADILPDDHETMQQYDGAYGIDVPAGAHTIVVENPGIDWFYVSYRLTNYVTAPNLRVLGLSNATSGLLWVQNKENTWWNYRNGIAPTPADASRITLGGLTPGTYAIEQWNTYTGAVTPLAPYVSADGTVQIVTPDGLTTDVAYKIRKQ